MRARRLLASAVVAVVTALGASACGGLGDSPSSASDRSTASAGPAAPLAFTSPAIGGGTVDGASFKGRPTLLWFWAPW